MDFPDLICCVLFLTLHGTTASTIESSDSTLMDGSIQEVHQVPCQITRGHQGRDIDLYCPSFDLQNFTVTIKFNERVTLTCWAADVNLTSINIDVGPIELFESKNCNMAGRFRQVLELWNIRDTKLWRMKYYSDVDFVLRRSEFEGVNVSQLEGLQMERSNIVEIEFDTFYDFVSLKTVSFNENKLKVLPDLFKHSKSLRRMEFGKNRLESLPDQFTAPSLKNLQLWSNNLTRINESLFYDCPSLNIAELSMNKIGFVSAKLLYLLPNLKTFSLLNNEHLSEIPPDLFQMNGNLSDVRLAGLNLSTIPENLFRGNTNLTEIMLQMNALETLPEKLFSGLSMLKTLHLFGNKLKHLSKNIFGDLAELELLDLRYNELSEWSYDISTKLISLKELSLSGNNFHTIESDYFYNLTNLENLYLDKNGLTYIDAGAFDNLELIELDLSHNNLTDTYDGLSFIGGLKEVVTLSLDWNRLESMPQMLCQKTKYLHMAHNKIKHINMEEIDSVKKIFLNDNQIETLNFRRLDDDLKMPDYEVHSQIEMYVDDNPLDCGCSAYKLIEFFDGTYQHEKIYDKFSIKGLLKCQGPPELAGSDVRELRSQDFSCNTSQIFNCPAECSCAVYPKYRSVNVSCNGLGLDVPPAMSSFAPDHVNYAFNVDQLVVDLSNNSISNFTSRDASYANVSELYLSSNELDLVSWLPSGLEVLELNDNRLENLDYRAISILNTTDSLKRLTLNDNHWICNCKLLNLTTLIKWKNVQIPHDPEILCASGQKVILMTEGALCGLGNQAALIAIGVCFFLFLIAIGVALVLYYKYEYHVKVWLYSKPLFMRFVAEEDLDRDKVYDAFLSYSHEDEEFVVRELISELEDGPEAYKLCVHIRDWIVGEFISKQIADSVANSRRTIIVLSPHYLRSEWATMEFRTAHTQAMREGRHRLVVILYGDIDPLTVEDEDLKTYLSSNTYVKWGDPWFWKKLRYVLPHKRNGFTNSNNANGKVKKSKNSRRMENIMVTIDKMDLINSPATPNLGTPPAVSLDPLLIKSNGLDFKSARKMETPPAEGSFTVTTIG